MAVKSRAAAAEGRAVSLLDVVRHSSGNLVRDDEGDWWAMYRLRGITYDLLSVEQKKEFVSALEGAIGTIPTRVKILSLVRNFAEEDYIRQLKARNGSSYRWNRLCDGTAQTIGRRRPFGRDFFLSVRLRPRAGTFEEMINQATDFISLLLRRAAHVPVEFGPEELDEARRDGHRYRGRFGNLILSPASPQDLMWLIRRGPYRAVGEPPVLREWKPRLIEHTDGSVYELYQPNHGELVNLIGDIPFKARMNGLQFYHGDGVISYQRFLGISSMSTDKLHHPGSEWGYTDAPWDICFDFDVTPAQAAERRRKGKSQAAREQAKHVRQAGGTPGLALAEAEKADQAAESQHHQNKPQLDCYTTVCISSSTESGLDDQEANVRQFYETLHSGVSGSGGTQVQAFSDFTPVGRRRHWYYPLPMPAITFAGGMPLGNSELGDGKGYYIGSPLQSNGVVTYDPALPIQYDKNASCAVVGDLGSGKSVMSMTMMLKLAHAGYSCFFVDPKGDSEKLDRVGSIQGEIRKIRISADSEARMPILSVYRPDQEAKTAILLRGVLLDLFDTSDQKAMAAATRMVIKEFMGRTHGRNRKMAMLVDEFNRFANDTTRSRRARDAAQDARDQFLLYLDEPLTRIILCDEVEGDEILSRERVVTPVTLVQTFDLDLPTQEDYDNNTISEEMRIGQTLMSVVAASAKQMAFEHRLADRRAFKALFFDEAWKFLQNGTALSMLRQVIREGRSLNVAAFVLTQLWRDLEPIIDLMSVRFLGRNERSPRDVRLGLEHLGVRPSDSLLRMVEGFNQGDFIHQDVHGRVGAMHYEVDPPIWLRELGSTPQGEGPGGPGGPGEGKSKPGAQVGAGTSAGTAA